VGVTPEGRTGTSLYLDALWRDEPGGTNRGTNRDIRGTNRERDEPEGRTGTSLYFDALGVIWRKPKEAAIDFWRGFEAHSWPFQSAGSATCPVEATGGRRGLMLDNGGNLAPGQPGLAFVVNNEGGAARVDWLPETIDLDADAAPARAARIGPSSAIGRVAHRHACEDWLRGFLAGGPRLAKESASRRRWRRDSIVACWSGRVWRWRSDRFARGSARARVATSACRRPTAGRPKAPMRAGRRPYSTLRDVWRSYGICGVWRSMEARPSILHTS
jgi:hypothetical protein